MTFKIIAGGVATLMGIGALAMTASAQPGSSAQS